MYPMILTRLIILAVLSSLGWTVAANELGQFERVETKTFDKKKFVFPDDMSAGKLNVLFLSLSSDQEGGKMQMEANFEWQAALDARGVFSDDVRAYHFSVASGVPFFIKGLMTRALRKSHDGKIPLDQSGVLFVDDLAEFAATPKIEVDGQPTVVLVSTDDLPLQAFKGTVSDEAVDEIVAAIESLVVAK